MHPVGGLGPHPAAGPVDHLGGHLLAPAGGQAVQEHRAGPGPGHQGLVHRVPLEGLQAPGRLGLLAHGGPHVGVDGVGAGHRLGRVVGEDRVAARGPDAVQGGRVEPVAGRAGHRHLHPGHGRGDHQRAGRVVGVAHVGQLAALEGPQLLGQSGQVSQGLHGVGPVAEQVDHRGGPHRGHALHGGVVEHPSPDEPVVAGQGGGHVLDALALVQAHLGPLYVDGVPAQGRHRHLHRVAGAGRGLLEHQGHALPGQHRLGFGLGGQLHDPGELVGGQVVDLQQMAHHDPPGIGSSSSGPRTAASPLAGRSISGRWRITAPSALIR